MFLALFLLIPVITVAASAVAFCVGLAEARETELRLTRAAESIRRHSRFHRAVRRGSIRHAAAQSMIAGAIARHTFELN